MIALLRVFRSGMRRCLATVGLVLVGAVALATPALACTAIMGPLYLNPASGKPGSVVVTSASGLKPFPAQYNLYFGGTCMTFTGKLLKVVTTDVNGGWSNVKVTIPKRATIGTHALCGVESYPNPGSSATSHDSFTVV